jgi:hypothetical protein
MLVNHAASLLGLDKPTEFNYINECCNLCAWGILIQSDLKGEKLHGD